jgi:hypothetical protein
MAVEVFHVVEYDDGGVYPCFCPIAEDHSADYLTPEEAVRTATAGIIDEVLNAHLSMKPNHLGWVGCECGEDYSTSYNTHLTQKLVAALAPASSDRRSS